MFGNKLKVVEGKKEVREVVKTCIVEEGIEHLCRLAQVTGRPEFNGGLTKDMLASLREKNLVWVVTRSKILTMFPYAASVKCPPRDSPVREGLGSAVMYIGDIPDFALRNMEIASDCGLSYFTIHSLFPMPVALGSCDPLLLGWVINPLINLTPVFKERFPELALAVVIAIWGEDTGELKM